MSGAPAQWGVWCALVAATLTTGWVAGHAGSQVLTAAAVMGIAAFKMRLIVRRFMELDHAPRNWRWAFDAWIVICATMIVGAFIFGLS